LVHGEIPSCHERLKQHRCRLAVGGSKTAVTAGAGEPISLPHNGATDDLGIDVQLIYETAHYDKLLEVLLTEIGTAVAAKREQLGYDGGNAREVPGP
jgi:hypothetical protein